MARVAVREGHEEDSAGLGGLQRGWGRKPPHPLRGLIRKSPSAKMAAYRLRNEQRSAAASSQVVPHRVSRHTARAGAVACPIGIDVGTAGTKTILITEFGEARGVESSWMWGDMEDQSEIEAAIARLEQLIEALKAAKPDEFKAAEERLRRVRDAKDPEERERLDLEMGVFPEDFLGQCTAEEMSAVQRRARESGGQLARDLEAYYGAIKWLRFWSDKGFKIAADF